MSSSLVVNVQELGETVMLAGRLLQILAAATANAQDAVTVLILGCYNRCLSDEHSDCIGVVIIIITLHYTTAFYSGPSKKITSRTRCGTMSGYDRRDRCVLKGTSTLKNIPCKTNIYVK